MRRFAILFFSLSIMVPIWGQTSTDDASKLKEATLSLDLRTATYFELAAWSERLDLSARGSRSELQHRLEEYYGLARSEVEPQEIGREIQIESADQSRYFTLEEPAETYLRLLGDVTLLMFDPDSDSTHRISADRIIYNESINSITASGNLVYVLEQTDKIETFTGESLTVNLDDWRGIFIRGTSTADRAVGEEELTFFYTGNTIYRLADDTVILQQGTITSSAGTDPYYHINADRIWLLGPGEWALSNAVLYVGRVPLFYFPFFFHPGNELIFHPATGYRDIEGFFIQTSTYLVGKKEKGGSTLSFLQVTDDESENYDTEPWGIFLQKVRRDETLSAPEESVNYLKILFDMYSRLGLYGGVAGSFAADESLFSVDFDFGVALSRDVFLSTEGSYTYQARTPEGEYQSRWNSSNFLGFEFPLRFGWDFDTKLNVSGLNLSVSFPLYSDPWFRRDFSDRSEEMDWPGLLGIDDDSEGSQEGPRSNVVSKTDRFAWVLRGSLNPDISVLRPFVQSLSLSRMTLSMNWRAKTLPASDLPYIVDSTEYQFPEREFYIPESYSFPALTGRISGAILPWPKTAAPQAGLGTQGDPGEGFDVRPLWETDPSPEEEEEEETSDTLTVPDIQGDLPLNRPFVQPETRHSLTYSLSPDVSVDSRFDSTEWIRPEDVDFATQYSIMSTRANGALQYNSNFFGSLLKLRNNLSLSGVYRNHIGGAADSVPNWDTLLIQDEQATFFRLSNGVNVTVSPLVGYQPLSKSGIQYAITSTLYQYTYDGELADHVVRTLEWDKEIVTAHSLGLTAVYSPSIGDQQASITSVLPPLDPVYTFELKSLAGPLTSTVSGGVRKITEWEGDPLKWTERFSFLKTNYFENTLTYSFQDDSFASNMTALSFSGFDGNLSFSESFTYDLLNDAPKESTSSLRIWWLTARLQAAESIAYSFLPGTGWQAGSEKDFKVTQVSTSFAYTLDEQRFWKNRISLSGSVNSSWTLNLLRATDSSMDFGLRVDLRIAEFLNLSIASKSVNKASYRYIPSIADSLGLDWVNPVVDIARSLNFFSRQERVNSYFNLESVSLSLVHAMPDWDLSIEYSGNPDLVEEDGVSSYEWAGEVSIFVQWRPIPEIKRSVNTKDGEISF